VSAQRPKSELRRGGDTPALGMSRPGKAVFVDHLNLNHAG
jgi:hypothetical protein